MKGNLDVRMKLEDGDDAPALLERLKEALEASGLEAKVRTGKVDTDGNAKVRISFAGRAQ